ncbi:MAG: isoprenyl transferase [Lachnospiraceae bacterium]|nr:isoprenyl transferase [Lachnospiraceae bacterium]
MRELKHLAIILDGNGRWAKKRGLPRTMGHVQGAKNVEKVCRLCHAKGIKYLTVYAFSTENWKRPEDEVKAIMGLLNQYLDSCIKTSKKDNMRVRLLGDREGLKEILPKIEELEEISKDNDGLQLQIAVNYGSRNEITRAVKDIAKEVKEGTLEIETIDEDLISNHLDTAGIPNPDIMVRTSGELRLSNYLLWQLAYSEFYFTSCAWPDFDEEELDKVIASYENRDRRFGGIKEE